jgi:hypothetical protein
MECRDRSRHPDIVLEGGRHLLESVDGPTPAQAKQVIAAKKPMFID